MKPDDRSAPRLGTRVPGPELIRRMALEALNRSRRDRHAARRLFKEWLRERDDLLEAIAGAAIDQAIALAIGRDLRIEREDVVRMARALPVVEGGVSVGAPVLPPQSACIPIPSADADSRRSARLVKHLGLYGFPLPETGIPLGDAKPWEVKVGSLYYGRHRKGVEQREQFLAFVWQSCPDHTLPEKKQRPVAKQIDLATLRLLDKRASEEVAKRTLASGSAA